MKYAKAVDKNQREIISYLEVHGCQVIRIGEPLDLLVGGPREFFWIMIEVKPSDTHSIQRGQLEFLSTAQGYVGIATTPEEALDLAYYPKTKCLNRAQQNKIVQWLIRNPDQTQLRVNLFRKVIAA